MNCPNEFIQTQFADGELPEKEAGEFAAHLKFCAVCRQRVSALKAENLLIAESLQRFESCESEQEFELPGIRGIAAFTAVFSAAAAIVRMGADIILGIKSQAGLDWLFPMNGSGLLNWLANGIFDLIEKGGPMMASLTERTGIIFLNLTILGALIAVARRAKGITALVGLTALLFFAVIPVHAVEIRKAERWGGVSVAAGETINDTLIVTGDSINISGTITGDLVAAGRQINIQGTVQGNVFAAAQRIQITGKVGGDIVGAGLDVFANGPIDGNFWGFGTRVALGANGKVHRDAVLLGTELNVDGEIGRDLAGGGALLDIGSAIGRNVRFYGQQILVHTPAKIGGSLFARLKSEKNAKIDPAVIIPGGKKIEIEQADPSKYRSFGFYVSQLLRLAGAFLIGMILFWIFPRAGNVSFSTSRALLSAGGIGFLALVATPIAALIVAMTLIGIPIGLAALALWLLGLYLAKIVVAHYIGRALIGRKDSAMSSIAISLLIGLCIVIIAVNLPYIGGWLNFFLILIGLGALVVFGWRAWKTRRQAEAPINAL
jgi:hypothetical protein